MDDYNLADIATVTRDSNSSGSNDGLFGGGGAAMLLLLLFFLLAAGGGGMFGGLGGLGGGGGAINGILTRTDLQQGFDTQEITRKLDGLTNGLSDGFYAQNTTMLNGFAGITAAVNSAAAAQAQCCCETQRAIDSVKYENAQNTCAITTAIHAEGEATRAAIAAQETAWLRDQLNQARCANSDYNQSQYILSQLGRYYTNPPCYNSCGNSCGGSFGNFGGFGSGFGYGLSLGLGYSGNNNCGCGCGCGCNNI